MPTIRIDDEVFTKLQERAKPFVDSPNDVLRRMFGLGGESNRKSDGTRRRAGRIEYKVGDKWLGARGFLEFLEDTHHSVSKTRAQAFETSLRGTGNGLSNLAKELASDLGFESRSASKDE